jgi:hypothetical protein
MPGGMPFGMPVPGMSMPQPPGFPVPPPAPPKPAAK